MTDDKWKEERERRVLKMSEWQFHLFALRMTQAHKNVPKWEPTKDTLDYLAENPARFVMYIAFCIGLRPWLWFGVAK